MDDPPLWIKSGSMIAPANEAAAQVVMNMKPGKALMMEPKELSAGTLEHHNFLMATAQLVFQNADWGDISFETWKFWWLKHKYGWGEHVERATRREGRLSLRPWPPHKLGDEKAERADRGAARPRGGDGNSADQG